MQRYKTSSTAAQRQKKRELKRKQKNAGAKRNAKDKRRESAELLPRERSTEPSDERLLALPAAAGDPQSVQVRVAVLQTAAVPCTANA